MADRRLQVFYTVAKLLSFTKAAETLHMTQPAVTFQIRQLEEQFNTRLFDRTHNRISLTKVGECLFVHTQRILELYEQMEHSVKEMTGDLSGVLLLGASTTIAEYVLPNLLGSFKRQYPEVSIRLRVANTDEIVSMIEDNLIDLGLVEAPVHNKCLAVEPCCTDTLVVITPIQHPLAHRSSINPNELLQYPFLLREEGSGTRDVIVDFLNKSGLSLFDLNIAMELGSSESIKGAVTAGMGISIMSKVAIHKDLQLNLLKEIPLNPSLERPFSFVHQKQKFRSRTMEELLNFARNYF